jgi:hypothetical protein
LTRNRALSPGMHSLSTLRWTWHTGDMCRAIEGIGLRELSSFWSVTLLDRPCCDHATAARCASSHQLQARRRCGGDDSSVGSSAINSIIDTDSHSPESLNFERNVVGASDKPVIRLQLTAGAERRIQAPVPLWLR